ncbi:MAG: hypothetical protein IPJ33_01795 [Gammaproteobacteria bacterium]|jgi:hypothetical protein|nr:hypothetical protein [Gammaproteobacteria bacterium]MBK7727253.1 hypothetical protein [Gammaproteobacteria bacterium]
MAGRTGAIPVRFSRSAITARCDEGRIVDVWPAFAEPPATAAEGQGSALLFRVALSASPGAKAADQFTFVEKISRRVFLAKLDINSRYPFGKAQMKRPA